MARNSWATVTMANGARNSVHGPTANKILGDGENSPHSLAADRHRVRRSYVVGGGRANNRRSAVRGGGTDSRMCQRSSSQGVQPRATRRGKSGSATGNARRLVARRNSRSGSGVAAERTISVEACPMKKFRCEYLAYNCRVHDFDNKPLDAGWRRGADAGLPGNYLCLVRFPGPAGTTLRMVENGVDRALSMVHPILHISHDCGRILAGQERPATGWERRRLAAGRGVFAGCVYRRYAAGVELVLRRGGGFGRGLCLRHAHRDLREVVSR